MVTSLTGVAMQASNTSVSRYAFLVFLAASTLWLFNAIHTRNRPLICTQSVLIVLNIIAVIRWFT